MAKPTILSENQKQLLTAIADEKSLRDRFYLTGGTALAEFYLHHRYSEDLDFFSETEFDPQAISVSLKKIQRVVGIDKTRYEQSFNRHLFFLQFGADFVKTEFTYFPFPRIQKEKPKAGLTIDSLLDIAINKIFTIYQKPRARDYIDLYCILQKEPRWTIDDLIKKAQLKFDWHVNPIQLGTQFSQAKEVKDYPRMIADVKLEKWQKFFQNEAQALTKSIFK